MNLRRKSFETCGESGRCGIVGMIILLTVTTAVTGSFCSRSYRSCWFWVTVWGWSTLTYYNANMSWKSRTSMISMTPNNPATVDFKGGNTSVALSTSCRVAFSPCNSAKSALAKSAVGLGVSSPATMDGCLSGFPWMDSELTSVKSVRLGVQGILSRRRQGWGRPNATGNQGMKRMLELVLETMRHFNVKIVV